MAGHVGPFWSSTLSDSTAAAPCSGCDGQSLAICDFELRFPNPKPILSAERWRVGVVNTKIAGGGDCAVLIAKCTGLYGVWWS